MFTREKDLRHNVDMSQDLSRCLVCVGISDHGGTQHGDIIHLLPREQVDQQRRHEKKTGTIRKYLGMVFLKPDEFIDGIETVRIDATFPI